MASIPSFSQKHEEFKEEFLTCPICTETYDGNKHLAKCLPCLHSFCQSCLQQYVKERRTFDCPKCRKTVQLEAEGDLTSLPNNFIVENLKEYHKIFNIAVPCGNCDEGEDAVFFCHDCACFICQTCMDMHKRMRTLRTHNLSTMAELREKKCNPMSQCQQRCEKHPKQEMTLYCQEQECRIPVCPTCVHVEHRGHDMVYVEAAVEKTTVELEEASAAIRVQLKDLAQVKDTVKLARKYLTMSYRQKKTEMNGTLNELHQMIDQRFDDACVNVDDLFQKEMSQLDEQEKSVDLLSSQMSSACEYAERSCSINHHVQLLDSSKNIKERLQELQDLQLPKEVTDIKEFCVSEEHVAAMDQLTSALKNICDVKLIASTIPPKPIPSGPIPAGFPGFPSPDEFPQPPPPPPPPPNTNFEFTASDEKPKSEHSPPKPVDPAMCTITLDPNPWRGKACTAKITTKSTDDQPIHIGGAKIQASLKWVQSAVGGLPGPGIDHDDGTYTITYTPLMYGASQLSVSINGDSMEGSPFIVRAGEEK